MNTTNVENYIPGGSSREPVAIVGIGCRFPGGAHSGEAFWKLLCEGFDAIGEVPSDRWSPTNFYDPDPRTPGKTAVRLGGYVQQRIQLFDAAFFGISPREAACLDPQQRLLLEVTWEAFEDAGIVPEKLAGGDTGVFAGGFMQDSASVQMGYLNRDLIGQHTSVGASLTMLSARLSYVFDLRGPCISVDTACSSSLVATHYACNAIWNGECSQALVAGVNVMLNPSVPIALTKAGFLSPDGRCKAFDASANGYVRSEGAGVVILKPLSAALRDKDRVYALIRGSAVNQDGRSNGITQPNQDAQEALLREAYSRAGITPRAVQYVEAHGTGTPVGDKTEASAIATVVSEGREAGSPCIVGSVKTNLGHMEGAAGVGGLIKAALALKHRQIPPHLHLHNPSPHIPFEKFNIRVPKALESWPATQGPLLASVNSFGYGGTNAHVVLEGAPTGAPHTAGDAAPSEWLIPLSARKPEALRAYAASLASWVRERRDAEGLTLADLAYSAGVRRSHHEHRGALLVKSLDEVTAKLEAYVGGDDSALVAAGRAVPGKAHKVVFVFTGMGPQWWGMGRELYETHPTFRATAEACEREFQQQGAGGVLASLLAGEAESRMEDPYVAQTTNFLLQVSLAATWRELGVQPDVIVGHSAGEAAAAYCAGALTLEDAVRVCQHRSRQQAKTAGQGRMLAVGLSAADATTLIASHPEVCVGAINAPASVALSGATAALEELGRILEQRQVFHRFVPGSVPYHSAKMDPLEAELREALSPLRPREAAVPLYSTVLGTRVRGDELEAGYWWRNVRDPVQFEAAVGQILEAGGDSHLFVEVGPHPVLSAALGACLKSRKRSGEAVPSLHREKRERTTLFTSLGRLFAAGAKVDFARQCPESACFFALPAYPWQREHYWLESAASLQDRLGTPGHPLLRRKVAAATPTWEAELGTGLLPFMPDHKVQGEVVLPGAAYVDAAMAMQKAVSGTTGFTLERLDIRNALVIPAGQGAVLRLSFDPETGMFHIHSYQRNDERSWALHATGRMLPQAIAPKRARFELEALQAACRTKLEAGWVYASLERSGFQYGPWFQGIQEISCNTNGEALARIELRTKPDADAEHYVLHPALLDACFQTLVTTISEGGHNVDPSATYLPVGINEIRVTRPAPARLWAYGRFSTRTESEICADLWMLDEAGEVIAELRGVRARALPKSVRQVNTTDDWFYHLTWEPKPLLPAERPASAEQERWVLFSDGSPLAKALDVALTESGRAPTLVTQGETKARLDERHFQVRPDVSEDLRELIGELATDRRSLHVAYLWSMEAPVPSRPTSITGIDACGRLLPVLQALVATSSAANHQFWMVTEGSQRVGDERMEHGAAAPLWAMARMSNVEHRQLRCVCVDLDASRPAASARLPALLNELVNGNEETEVAYRGDVRYGVRLERIAPSAPARREPVSLDQVPVILKAPAQRGNLAGLAFERTTRVRPGPGQVEIEVRAAGLNFKDIAKLRGLLSDTDLDGSFFGRKLGMDCSGVVTAVGEGVTNVRVGDGVIAVAPGCLASHVIARAIDVWPKPDALGFEEATGISPFVYAIHALSHVARLRAKETVLIHSAAGGTGLAAVHWARHLGAEVLATAGTPEKRALLESLGVKRVMDSRSLSFADEVLEYTQGRGVDVVLNTLVGEGLRRSLSVLAPHGRFVDLTYFGNQRFELTPHTYPRNLSLLGVDVDSLFVHRPQDTAELLAEVSRAWHEGAIRPLPVTVFPPSQVAEAFSHLAERRNIGRATVSMRAGEVRVPPSSNPGLRPDGTYLVTGGLGGFGLATAQWLVEQGARHLLLVGRGGAATDEAKRGVAALEQRGAAVKVLRVDVSVEAEVARMLEEARRTMPPLRGVMHAAAGFGGEFLAESTAEKMRKDMSPKMLGAWHLHTHTRELPLDFFVLFSSVAGTLGETGTGSYSAANNFLDALAHVRRSQGLPCISIGWGLLADVGIGVKDARIGALVQSVGHKPMPVKELLGVLGEALVTKPTHIFVSDTDWARWALTHPLLKPVPRLSLVIPKDSELGISAIEGQNLKEAVRELEGPERESLVRARLTEQLATVLRMSPDRIDDTTPLGDYGMDSLMASELSVRLERDTGMLIPMMMLMRRASVHDVVQRLLEMLAAPDAGAAASAAPKPVQHTFTSADGLTLYGHLSLPPGPGPHPAVVVHTMDPGGALNAEGQYVRLAEHAPLLARGYAVFTVDQRGAPGHGEEYMALTDLGGDEVNDISAAARYLGTLPEIDSRRLALMGTSRGAYVALLAACRTPELWKAAVLSMGFYDPVVFVHEERRLRPDSTPLRQHGHSWEEIEQYFTDESRHPLLQLGQVRAPLLVIHGDADGRNAVDHALRLQQAAQAKGLTAAFQLVPGMDHDVEQRHPAWPHLWGTMGDFLDSHLGVKASEPEAGSGAPPLARVG
ncbi:type I polyketide synthase [Pyxidicoccus xibeiensis]|uniref:type I polyketide synthase n=1 Tax=Pyxidicoccus xibeiensis TaxID=2906759 RepID=UPI0020A70EAB|nr:type I polyketide synthase [Pyxidicoccus xibeiensis]MCP3138232.1 SDR family NAD(P)-dependent oxidoreductase [Pyxidicoccus xibeiensis]